MNQHPDRPPSALASSNGPNGAAGSDRPELRGRAANRAAWLWGSVVVAFLALQLVIGGLAYGLASRDPSVAVMPDYHERALRWDDEVASRRQSDALGWRATALIGQLDDDETGGWRDFEVRVLDAAGEPILGGQAELAFFHHVRAGDHMRRPLAESAPGVYSARLPLVRLGLWDLHLTLTRGEAERFRWTRTVDLATDRRFEIASEADPNTSTRLAEDTERVGVAP